MKNKRTDAARKRIVSERFCSRYLNSYKLMLLVDVDKDNIKLKNSMSETLFNNRHLFLSHSKYDLVKMFAASFKSRYLKAWNVQAMFADCTVMYMNFFDALKSNLSLKTVYKPATIAYYKKTTSIHKAGDIKEIIYNKHWTSLSRLVKALVFFDEKRLDLPENLKP